MSELKVNKISPRSGTDVTLGDSGDTFTVPAGASIVNNGTATGFGATVTWDTTAKTTGFTAVSGVGYFCDTTSAGFTVTLPATPSAGDIVGLVDYAGTFDTNALVIDPNGEDIEGGTSSLQLDGEREGVVLVYVDSTQGWLPISGINEGTDALEPLTYSIDFLVIAGGGSGGGHYYAGGGGAGGYRTSTQTVTQGTVITVTVGDGGAAIVNSVNTAGNTGSNSSISGSGLSTITSAGGGGGGGGDNGSGSLNGLNGGSGGGGSAYLGAAGGSGNTPSTAPSQGNNGGSNTLGAGNGGGCGGGGASAVGVNSINSPSGTGGAGGAGTASSITGSSTTRAGGGGGAGQGGTEGAGGIGGGGAGASPSGNGTSGTVNTGGGGGGASGYTSVNFTSGAGGKGVVILAMPLANFSNTTTGSPTESDDGTTKVLIFNGDGSYTA
jgi:hypothetical protein